MAVFGDKRRKECWLSGLVMIMLTICLSVAARGAAARGGYARLSAASGGQRAAMSAWACGSLGYNHLIHKING